MADPPFTCGLLQSVHNIGVELKFYGAKGHVRHFVEVGYPCPFRGGGACPLNIPPPLSLPYRRGPREVSSEPRPVNGEAVLPSAP
jgi:hypothetical protein